MGEIERQLQFKSHIVQLQGVLRLRDQLESAQVKIGKPVNMKKPEPAALLLLWKMCSEADPFLAGQACHCLVQLVRSGVLEEQYVLDGLLNHAPRVKSVGGVVAGINDLLLQRVHQVASDVCGTVHPFVTLVQQRPDSWSTILEISFLAVDDQPSKEFSSTVKFISPFLKFILLHSSASIPVHLPTVMLSQLPLPAQKQEICQLMFNLLPLLKVDDAASFGKSSFWIETLLDNFPRAGPAAQHLVVRALSLAHFALRKDFPCAPLLSLIVRRVSALTEPVVHQLCLLLCLECLQVAPLQSPLLLDILTSLTSDLVPFAPLLLAMVLPPLLNIANCLVGSVSGRARRLFGSLYQRTAEMSSQGLRQESVVVGEEFVPLLGLCSLSRYLHLSGPLSGGDGMASRWLNSTRQHLTGSLAAAPPGLVHFVAGMFLTRPDLLQDSLELLVDLATYDVTLSPSLLPLVLLKLDESGCTAEQCALTALRLPDLATHKMAVGPILASIRAMLSQPELSPFALRLVTKLWQRQGRILPHLLPFLKVENAAEENLEHRLSRLASIKDVCDHRGEQCGADMLPLISEVLNLPDVEAASVVLCVESLCSLCRVEEMDTGAVWKLLALKFGADERPLVISSLCRLFSLVPLEEGEDCQDLCRQALCRLWHFLLKFHRNIRILREVFASLAEFPQGSHQLSLIPEEFRQGVSVPEEEEEDTREEEGKQGREESVCVPGIVFVNVLRRLECCDAVQSFRPLLRSLLSRELAGLPRGIYHRSFRPPPPPSGRSKRRRSRALLLGRDALYQRYAKLPAGRLKSALAVAVMRVYEPIVQQKADGTPKRESLIAAGKTYRQLLHGFLTQIAVDDIIGLWQLPDVWSSFMDRCLAAFIKCRQAELMDELQRGRASDADDSKLLQNTAWLWARDKLTDQIKSASRGDCLTQKNAVLAIAGLAKAFHSLVRGLGPATLALAADVPEHVGPSYWFSLIGNTLLQLVDDSYQPSCRILSIRKPAEGSAHVAGLAFAAVAPSMLMTSPKLVLTALQLLKKNLTSDEVALSLAYLLVKLSEDSLFVDIFGNDGLTQLWTALVAFEDFCFNETAGAEGCVFALGATLSSIASDGKPESIIHARKIYNKIEQQISVDKIENDRDMMFWLSKVQLSLCLYSLGSLSLDQASAVAKQLEDMLDSNRQSQLFHVMVGVFLHGLLTLDHPHALEANDRLTTKFFPLIANMKLEDTENCAAALCPLSLLASLAGSHHSLVKLVEVDEGPAGLIVNFEDLVLSLRSLLPSSEASSCLLAADLLSRLACTQMDLSQSNVTEPQRYHYLPDSSILRASVDYLLDNLATAEDGCSLGRPQLIVECLMETNADRPLPPLKWKPLLMSLFHKHPGSELSSWCLKMALTLAPQSSSAAEVLCHWFTPTLFTTLEPSQRSLLLSRLAVSVPLLPIAKLEIFVQTTLIQALQHHAFCDAAMEGLCEALSFQSNVESKDRLSLLQQAFCQAFERIVAQQKFTDKAAVGLSGGACHLPDEKLCQLLVQLDFSTSPALIFQYRLVLSEKLKLDELSLLDAKACHDRNLWIVLSFLQVFGRSDVAGLLPVARLRWLVGMLKQPKQPKSQLVMLALCCLAWCPLDSWQTYDLALAHPNFLLDDIISADSSPAFCTLDSVLCRFPHALFSLLSGDPWQEAAHHVQEWIIGIVSVGSMDGLYLSAAEASIHAVRHLPQLRNVQPSSKVAGLAGPV